MKRQLQGIALILFSILLMLGYGNAPFFDFSFRWSLIFSIVGIVVLQTKVNRKNEKSPAKFTRPKMGITKQAGEKSHRQPG